MLAYSLAIIIAVGSVTFYMAAFFVPEMHRRQDFIWSGLGMFYAVVLWFCAGRITGAVLLGQTASVVLLGWLGWHTLELRRELTPEPVRTPVTWDDLQRWGQSIQQMLDHYGKLGSLFSSIQAIWADVSHGIADLRNRTAGPRGVDSGVPPLTRSPAYEFETDAGEGESVPSEFATVSTRTREAAAEKNRTVASAQSTPEEPVDVKSPVNAGEDLSKPLPVVEAELIEEPDSSMTTEATTPEQATPSVMAIPSARRDSRDRPITQPSASEPMVTSPRLPAKSTNPVAGVIRWVGDVVKSFRKPKPQRGVVEIPPRPPSIPRSPTAETAPQAKHKPLQQRTSQSQRGVIDIPPRPPSIPRSPQTIPNPSATQPTSRQASAPENTNWVDVGEPDLEVANWTDPDAKGPDTSPSPTESQTIPPPPAPSKADPPDAAKWPNDADTNWPDDEDTNWPD